MSSPVVTTILKTTVCEREEHLARAGYNVLNLDPSEVAVDLLSDVPHRFASPPWNQEASREPSLDDLAHEIYGPAQYVFTTKGRAAEAVLASLLTRPGRAVLTHGLFKTTERAVLQQGGSIETAPRRIDETSCDVDLAWLDDRLARGNVGSVYLEPNNNGLGGVPLHLSNLEAVAYLCRRYGALLLLDATRLLSNAAQLGGDILETARRFTRLADAFTASLGKEFLAPYGALLAVRSRELHQQAFLKAFQSGVLLEPIEGRQALAAGMQHVRRDPALLERRSAQVYDLAETLDRHGVPCRRPWGGHAVYVSVARLLEGREGSYPRALECLLYRQSGVRAYIWPFAAIPGHMRLAVPLARYTYDELAPVAAALRALFAHPEEAPALVENPEERALGMFARFRPAP